MSRTKFRAWITKYALTTGIQVEVVEDCFDISPDVVSVVGRSNCCLHGYDWHRTEAAAIARAEEMRVAELKSLDKQIKRLSAMKFGGDK